MFVPFDSLPTTARVWIYQTDKRLNKEEVDFILKRAEGFIDSWESHGRKLKGSAKISHEHFLIVAIDESYSPASGCSIDKSVHFVQDLERELNLSLLSRSKQGVLVNGDIQFFPIGEAKKWISSGVVTPSTETFNNNIENKLELEEKWIVPAEESWLAKFFKNHN